MCERVEKKKAKTDKQTSTPLLHQISNLQRTQTQTQSSRRPSVPLFLLPLPNLLLLPHLHRRSHHLRLLFLLNTLAFSLVVRTNVLRSRPEDDLERDSTDHGEPDADDDPEESEGGVECRPGCTGVVLRGWKTVEGGVQRELEG